MAPVGVIIYSNAELMGIPMEIIIKQYKSTLGNRCFPTLADYVNDFLTFLTTKSMLFHFPSNETTYVQSLYTDLLAGLNGDYELSVRRKIQEVQRDLSESELKEIQISAVKGTLSFIDRLPSIPNLNLYDYIKRTYGNGIKQYISIQFSWIADPYSLS